MADEDKKEPLETIIDLLRDIKGITQKVYDLLQEMDNDEDIWDDDIEDW